MKLFLWNMVVLILVCSGVLYGDQIPECSQVSDTVDLTSSTPSVCEKHEISMEIYNSIGTVSSIAGYSFEPKFPNCRKTVEGNSHSLVIQYYCKICEAEKNSYLKALKQKAEEDLEKAAERYHKKEERKKKQTEK